MAHLIENLDRIALLEGAQKSAFVLQNCEHLFNGFEMSDTGVFHLLKLRGQKDRANTDTDMKRQMLDAHRLPADAEAFLASLPPMERKLHEIAATEAGLGSSYFMEKSHGYKVWKATVKEQQKATAETKAAKSTS